jgi:hypothetical protein
MGRLKLLGEQEGGGTDDHSALSNLGYAQSGHSGFVPSQGEALIDILRLNQNLIRDSEGNDRLQLNASAPHITLTGQCKITQETAIGGGDPEANKGLVIAPSPAPQTAYWTAIFGSPQVSIPPDAAGGSLEGLRFTISMGGGAVGAVLNYARALEVGINTMSLTATIQQAILAYLASPLLWFGAPSVSTWKGLYAGPVNSNRIVDAYGAHIEDITSNTGFTRLLEVGPSTPYLRLVGGADPPANKSNLYLKFGGTLYRVIKSGSYMTLEAP